MNLPIEGYRQLAAEALEQAAASTLPQVKMRYLRSAEHWEKLAEGLEVVALAKARNEAARQKPQVTGSAS
jgi:hypothetical protein